MKHLLLIFTLIPIFIFTMQPEQLNPPQQLQAPRMDIPPVNWAEECGNICCRSETRDIDCPCPNFCYALAGSLCIGKYFDEYMHAVVCAFKALGTSSIANNYNTCAVEPVSHCCTLSLCATVLGSAALCGGYAQQRAALRERRAQWVRENTHIE